MILTLLCMFVLAFASWSMFSLEQNYRRASSMGVPVLRLPIDPLNLLWMVSEQPILRFLDWLDVDLGTFGIYGRRGWHFADKAKSHEKYGPIYAMATPRTIWVQVAEPHAISEVLKRRADFVRPSEMYTLLEVYGPCISTAKQHDWPRHRKVLAAPFNESIMEFVWSESRQQAEQMLRSWRDHHGGKIPSYARDTRTLSLNVLASTAFRRSYTFVSKGDAHGTDEPRNYRDALQVVLDNVLSLMLLPPWLMRLSCMPGSMQRLGRAAEQFRQHMVQTFNEESALVAQNKPGSGGLMTVFLSALRDATKAADNVESSLKKGMSRDEIYGNIFVINFAGHDTTANTLAFSLLLLALNPDVQEWVARELEGLAPVDGDGPPQRDWTYRDTYPRLKRCRAVLLETLRVYPPIMAIPKMTSNGPRDLQVGNRTITIPANAYVQTMALAVHTHRDYWADPLAWRPSRWIVAQPAISDEADDDSHKEDGEEQIFEPQQGMYVPWSDGPQNCLGQKFSQVEYVAVLATLLVGHRIVIVPRDGEAPEQANARAARCLEDCDMQMLLRLRHADSVQLGCVAVEEQG